jgi:UDP:flavonoid glycosyltransferase YjiC (YdhE family)
MRITVIAIGSQGDVQPFAALGAGLAKAGFTVRLASHESFRDLANAGGLEFAPITGNPRDIVQGEQGQAWLQSTDNYLLFLKQVSRIARGMIGRLSSDMLEGSRGSDALIYSLPLAVSGYSTAEVLGIPGIPASLYPLHPTGAFPSIMTPTLPLYWGPLNRLTGAGVAELFWLIVRPLLATRTRTEAGLGRLPLRIPLKAWRKRGQPFLYGYSPAVIPRPGDWRETEVVCGYWFGSRNEEWKAPPDLLHFMKAGPAPLYVGFGSMASGDSTLLTQSVLEALKRTGLRAVISSGWGGLRTESLPARVFPVGHIPHDWLFPQCSMAVHHGGAGTTAAVLRAGIPSIVVPFFADQFFWGHLVQSRGLGPAALPHKKLSAEALEHRIRAVLTADGIRQRCADMAGRIAREDGVGAAVAAVDGYLRSTTLKTIH